MNTTKMTEANIKLQLTRVFDAPRELVFQAWTNADQIKEWFNDRFASVESRDRHEQGWAGCLNALGQFIAK